MGSRATVTLRGIGRLERRFNRDQVDETNSDYTEAGPRPGVPDLPDGGRLVARVSAAQSDDAEVRVQRQGYPGLDSAAVAYRTGTESGASDWRGWDPPVVVQDHAWVEWTSTNAYTVHDVCTLPESQRPVALYGDEGNELWKASTWQWADHSWSTAVDVGGEAADMAGQNLPCAICAVAEDHLLAMVMEGTASPGTSALYRSSDQGDTWTLVALDPIDANATWTGKMRMVYQPRSGQIILCASYTTSGNQYVRQWVSDDLATFVQVDDLEVDTDGVWTLLAFPSGRTCLVYANAAGELYQRRILDGRDSFDTAPASTIDDTVDLSEVEGSVDADGIGWLIARETSSADTWQQWVTLDEGSTWTQADMSAYESLDVNEHVHTLSATFAAGRMVVLHNATTSDTTYDDSLGSVWLGGWGKVSVGRLAGERSLLAGRKGSGASALANTTGQTLLPITDFQEYGTVTTVTGGTLSMDAGRVKVVTTAGQNLGFKRTFTDARLEWQGVIEVDATSALGNELRVYCHSGTRAIYVRFDRNSLELWDNDTSQIGGTINVDLTDPMVLRVERTASFGYRVSYRRPWSSDWTTLTGDLSQVASSATEIGWGMFDAVACTAYFGYVWLGSFTSGRDAQFGSQSGTSVLGKPLGSRPYPLADLATLSSSEWVEAARLSLQAGPGAIGEVIDVDAAHDYPLEHIFPWDDPSPAKRWRSTDTTEHLIDVNLGGSSAVDTFGSTSIVWPLIRVNFRTAYLEGWDGSAWTTIATWDAATGFATSLSCTVDGEEVTPASGTSAGGRYVHQHELVGGYLELTGSGQPYPIEACEGGVWAGSGTTTKKALLRVSTPSGASAPASGACRLWHHSGVVVAHDVANYQRYRIRIPSQTTAEGYFTASMMTPGAFKPMGRQWDWAWSEDHQRQVEQTGGGRGPARIRQRRPVARETTISQPEGYLLHHLRGSLPDPAYVAADTGDPLAAREDTIWALAGMLREVRGGEDPVVLLRKVGNAGEVITDPTLWMYAHIVSDVSVENIRGNEGVNEHQRLAPLTFREITGAEEE